MPFEGLQGRACLIALSDCRRHPHSSLLALCLHLPRRQWWPSSSHIASLWHHFLPPSSTFNDLWEYILIIHNILPILRLADWQSWLLSATLILLCHITTYSQVQGTRTWTPGGRYSSAYRPLQGTTSSASCCSLSWHPLPSYLHVMPSCRILLMFSTPLHLFWLLKIVTSF